MGSTITILLLDSQFGLTSQNAIIKLHNQNLSYDIALWSIPWWVVEVYTATFNYIYNTGVWEYIESTRDLVCDLERRVRLAKANVESMCTLMAGWSKSPLYQRKEDKHEPLLKLEVTTDLTISM